MTTKLNGQDLADLAAGTRLRFNHPQAGVVVATRVASDPDVERLHEVLDEPVWLVQGRGLYGSRWVAPRVTWVDPDALKALADLRRAQATAWAIHRRATLRAEECREAAEAAEAARVPEWERALLAG